MNILILSAGTRNKIVQYFKKNITGKVIATDMQAIAPAIYEADTYYVVPRIDDSAYLEIIYDICIKEKINALLTLIDPELSLLAAHRSELESLGVTFVGSSYALCEMAHDKMQMYHWLKSHGYNCAKSYAEKDDFYQDLALGKVTFPILIKPIRGSASIATSKVEDEEMLEVLWKHTDGLMIQEVLKGQEIGADVYIDMISHEVVSIFTKKKLRMRAGETDKSVSFKDPKLFELIEKFAIECGWNAQIDIDIFDIHGDYYFSEVNPRFGGGYPHAYECGCNHIKLIDNNINGIANKKNIGAYEDGIYMMKYNEVTIKKL